VNDFSKSGGSSRWKVKRKVDESEEIDHMRLTFQSLEGINMSPYIAGIPKETPRMNIGIASEKSGLPSKTIRPQRGR
jgi:hypothetical protein